MNPRTPLAPEPHDDLAGDHRPSDRDGDDGNGRPGGEAAERGMHPVLKVLIAVFLLASAAMWAFGLWGPRSDPPGTLDDPAFGLAAEAVCARTVEAIDALPPAHRTPDPEVRAGVITEANALLAAQLSELDTMVPAEGDDRRRVTAWLGDWRTYLEDRASYAEELAVDRDARLFETEKGGDHISQALEFFAQINQMPSCAPPGDVA